MKRNGGWGLCWLQNFYKCYILQYSTFVRTVNHEHSFTVRSSFNFIEALVSIQLIATRYLLNYPDLKYNARFTNLHL